MRRIEPFFYSQNPVRFVNLAAQAASGFERQQGEAGQPVLAHIVAGDVGQGGVEVGFRGLKGDRASRVL